MSTVKKASILTFLALASLAFSACNTMNGVGKDVERAGEKIQDNSRR